MKYDNANKWRLDSFWSNMECPFRRLVNVVHYKIYTDKLIMAIDLNLFIERTFSSINDRSQETMNFRNNPYRSLRLGIEDANYTLKTIKSHKCESYNSMLSFNTSLWNQESTFNPNNKVAKD